MIKRKLFVVFSVFLILCVNVVIKAQSSTAIVLNEYSASNTGTPVDNFGQQSDWVEIRNHHTAQVNLSGYYLSNDRNNLFKWKIPGGFLMGVETYSVVWLSGRNTVVNGNYHANFTLDQCKNQWLILSTSTGVIRDSIFIQKTKAGQSWGRVDPDSRGINAWRLYTAHSFLFPNPTMNNYRGYTPTPKMVASPATNPVSNTAAGVNAGGFCDPSTIVYFKLENNLRYDTAFHSCFNVYYTTDGSYPVVGGLSTTQVFDSLTPITIDTKAKIIRAISVVNPTLAGCPQDFLPGFCETNTYWSDPDYNAFDGNFGVLSYAIDPVDTFFFSSNGNPPNTPIHVEYYDGKKQITEGYGLINRPPNESWLTKQKGFNITIDDKQGFGCNFEGNIFNVDGLGTSSRTVFPTLQLYAGDIESHSSPLSALTATSYGTGLRDVILQSLAVKNDLNVNPLHVKPVIVFKNGIYNGVYTLKEVYDKYYENYYHSQSKDSLDLAFYHNTDGYVSYPQDGSVSKFLPFTAFKTGIYDVVTTKPIGPSSTGPYYKAVMNLLDKSSLMDYMIVNSYAMNSDLWDYNIAYAKGGLASKPGNKWHYYLWNMPATFNFTAVATNTVAYANPYYSPCYTYSNSYVVSPVQAGNSHGAIMKILMGSAGNTEFQTDYKNRYQDLMNTALKCENVLKHFDYVANLYRKEMKYHEDPGNGSPYASATDIWDSNMYKLRVVIEKRCFVVANSFTLGGCFGLAGPYNISVNVEPVGAGVVKLNSILLDTYPWYGSYFQESAMSFKAIPTNTTYIFDHWEVKNNQVLAGRAISLDSIAISFVQPDDIVAVFTDKSADVLAGVNVPTGFTPNGDGHNDYFRPLGSARFSTEYEMTVWNRWGQEVYRSTDPLDAGWDGHYKGQDAITGVYAYIIKYKNIYGEDKLLKGNVTLTR